MHEPVKNQQPLTSPFLSRGRVSGDTVRPGKGGRSWLQQQQQQEEGEGEEEEEEVTGLQTRLADEFVNVISARGIYRSISSTLPEGGGCRKITSAAI